jgi:hypothetical protein
VLRDRRLADAEFPLNLCGDVAGRPLASGQQLKDPTPDRIAEDIERVHPPTLTAQTYITQS